MRIIVINCRYSPFEGIFVCGSVAAIICDHDFKLMACAFGETGGVHYEAQSPGFAIKFKQCEFSVNLAYI